MNGCRLLKLWMMWAIPLASTGLYFRSVSPCVLLISVTCALQDSAGWRINISLTNGCAVVCSLGICFSSALCSYSHDADLIHKSSASSLYHYWSGSSIHFRFLVFLFSKDFLVYQVTNILIDKLAWKIAVDSLKGCFKTNKNQSCQCLF